MYKGILSKKFEVKKTVAYLTGQESGSFIPYYKSHDVLRRRIHQCRTDASEVMSLDEMFEWKEIFSSEESSIQSFGKKDKNFSSRVSLLRQGVILFNGFVGSQHAYSPFSFSVPTVTKTSLEVNKRFAEANNIFFTEEDVKFKGEQVFSTMDGVRKAVCNVLVKQSIAAITESIVVSELNKYSCHEVNQLKEIAFACIFEKHPFIRRIYIGKNQEDYSCVFENPKENNTGKPDRYMLLPCASSLENFKDSLLYLFTYLTTAPFKFVENKWWKNKNGKYMAIFSYEQMRVNFPALRNMQLYYPDNEEDIPSLNKEVEYFDKRVNSVEAWRVIGAFDEYIESVKPINKIKQKDGSYIALEEPIKGMCTRVFLSKDTFCPFMMFKVFIKIKHKVDDKKKQFIGFSKRRRGIKDSSRLKEYENMQYEIEQIIKKVLSEEGFIFNDEEKNQKVYQLFYKNFFKIDAVYFDEFVRLFMEYEFSDKEIINYDFERMKNSFWSGKHSKMEAMLDTIDSIINFSTFEMGDNVVQYDKFGRSYASMGFTTAMNEVKALFQEAYGLINVDGKKMHPSEMVGITEAFVKEQESFITRIPEIKKEIKELSKEMGEIVDSQKDYYELFLRRHYADFCKEFSPNEENPSFDISNKEAVENTITNILLYQKQVRTKYGIKKTSFNSLADFIKEDFQNRVSKSEVVEIPDWFDDSEEARELGLKQVIAVNNSRPKFVESSSHQKAKAKWKELNRKRKQLKDELSSLQMTKEEEEGLKYFKKIVTGELTLSSIARDFKVDEKTMKSVFNALANGIGVHSILEYFREDNPSLSLKSLSEESIYLMPMLAFGKWFNRRSSVIAEFITRKMNNTIPEERRVNPKEKLFNGIVKINKEYISDRERPAFILQGIEQYLLHSVVGEMKEEYKDFIFVSNQHDGFTFKQDSYNEDVLKQINEYTDKAWKKVFGEDSACYVEYVEKDF
jgi:phage host-nuclease inhibitor protein Gam